jgi:hypothetical protein
MRITIAPSPRQTVKALFARRTLRGFSIIEGLVAMIVIGFVVLALLGVGPAVHGFAIKDSERVQAIAAGQQYLDIIRQYVQTKGVDTSLPLAPTVAVDPGYSMVSNEALPSQATFSMTPSCSTRSLFSFYCSVSVSWQYNGNEERVDVASIITSEAGF